MRLMIATAALLALGACASSGGSGTGLTSDVGRREALRVNPNVISQQEIAAQSFSNAWQAVRALRPTWPAIPAYVKNARIAFERLEEVPIAEVMEIRLLTREQARVRFGPEAQQTILVVSK